MSSPADPAAAAESARCSLLLGASTALFTLVCGVAGTFTPLMMGSAYGSMQLAPSVSNLTYSVSLPITSSFLSVCLGGSCTAMTSAGAAVAPAADAAGTCASLLSLFPSTCYSAQTAAPTLLVAAFPGMAYAFGSAQLQAGLAFAIIAWLVDALALLLAAVVLLGVRAVPAATSRARLATLAALAAASALFRSIALGCGINYEYKLLNAPGPLPQLLPALNWVNLPMTGFILLFLALALSVVSIFTFNAAKGMVGALEVPPPAAAATVASATAAAASAAALAPASKVVV